MQIDFLAQEVKLSAPTVKKHLFALDVAECLIYVPPPRTNPMNVIGDITMVDFPRLLQRSVEAHEKLASVINRFNHPDAGKQQYLTDYFMK